MLNQTINGILGDTAQQILRAVQDAAGDDTWNPVFDEDGNENLPSDEREVLVFLCGDRDLFAPRPSDAGWGMRFGFFEHDRRRWRAGGKIENYVTHWRECPAPPQRDVSDKEPATP